MATGHPRRHDESGIELRARMPSPGRSERYYVWRQTGGAGREDEINNHLRISVEICAVDRERLPQA